MSKAVTQPTTKPATQAASPQPSAAKPAPKPEARPYHHGSLRESLLQAAETLLTERGAPALSLRDVAKAAGVSHAAPYHHFSGLDELLAAVAQRGFVVLGDAMAAAATRSNDPRENLLAICEAYVAFALRQPAQFRLMFGPLLARGQMHPDLRNSAERSFGVLMAAALAYDPGTGALLGLSGWSLAHGLANLAIDGAFDALPAAQGLPSAPPQALARLMAERLLPPTLHPAGRAGAQASTKAGVARKARTPR